MSSCSSQEEHVLKPSPRLSSPRRLSCSSQEEHVLKLSLQSRGYSRVALLLARGACIETSSGLLLHGMRVQLLLARGACIETLLRFFATGTRKSCSSQEEHVLKHYIIMIDTMILSCSSQEEHVLKPCSGFLQLERGSCSSQEEHVLKPVEYERLMGFPDVAPRKRSMY